MEWIWREQNSLVIKLSRHFIFIFLKKWLDSLRMVCNLAFRFHSSKAHRPSPTIHNLIKGYIMDKDMNEFLVHTEKPNLDAPKVRWCPFFAQGLVDHHLWSRGWCYSRSHVHATGSVVPALQHSMRSSACTASYLLEGEWQGYGLGSRPVQVRTKPYPVDVETRWITINLRHVSNEASIPFTPGPL